MENEQHTLADLKEEMVKAVRKAMAEEDARRQREAAPPDPIFAAMDVMYQQRHKGPLR